MYDVYTANPKKMSQAKKKKNTQKTNYLKG